MRRDHARRRVRSRWVSGGRWRVHARVERFAEPALLLLLAEQPAHGYELLERLPALEEEGVVSSTWDASAAGPAKRRYELTDSGRRLLDQWADALRKASGRIEAFIDRYERREEVKDAPRS